MRKINTIISRIEAEQDDYSDAFEHALDHLDMALGVLFEEFEGRNYKNLYFKLQNYRDMLEYHSKLEMLTEEDIQKKQDAIDTLNIDERELPTFVMLRDSALRLLPERKSYFRDGGEWEVDVKIKNGILVSDYHDKSMKLHDIPLLETTEKIWRESNGEYAPPKIEITRKQYSDLKDIMYEAMQYRMPIKPILSYDDTVLIKVISSPAKYLVDRLPWLERFVFDNKNMIS